MSKFNPRAFALALVATTLTVGGTAALAQDFRSGEQRASSAALARVISVTANMDRISEQSQHCTEQQQVVTTPGQAGWGTTLAGSLIGGAIASPIGKGSGKAVAVAAGSTVGAHIARNMAEQNTTTTVVTAKTLPSSSRYLALREKAPTGIRSMIVGWDQVEVKG